MEIRRKTARGMTMVEVLIVLGIAAVAIAGVIGMVDAARTTMIGDNNARAIHNFDAALNRFKTVRRACGGDVPTASFDPIGDEVTATAGVTSPPNPTAGDAEERCENHIWETFTSAIRRPNDEAGAEGLVAYDEDGNTEWVIAGGGENAIEVGWMLWPTDADSFDNIIEDGALGDDDLPCMPTAAADTGPAAIVIFGMANMDICESTRNKVVTTPRGIYSTSCVFDDDDPGTREGDALLLACILDTSV